jgi:hypothetical protein
VPDISPKPRLGVTSIEGEQHSISLRRLSLPFSLHIPAPTWRACRAGSCDAHPLQHAPNLQHHQLHSLHTISSHFHLADAPSGARCIFLSHRHRFLA